MLLTLAIFFVTVFVLGFIGDFIINLYLDPYDVITSIPLGSQDDSSPFYLEEEDATWVEHFVKGFASLGLLGFAKVMLANPWNWWNVRRYGGGRAGTTGRDRLANVSMIAVAVGIFTVVFVRFRNQGLVDHFLTQYRHYGKAFALGAKDSCRGQGRESLTCRVTIMTTMMSKMQTKVLPRQHNEVSLKLHVLPGHNPRVSIAPLTNV